MKNNINKRTKKNRKINILIKPTLKNKNNWFGNGLDILFGLIYLIDKFKNISIPITEIKQNILYDISLVFNCDSSKKSFNEKYKSYKLSFPTQSKEIFLKNLKKSLKSKKRFVIIHLALFWTPECGSIGHSNMLIIDTKFKTIERFEPYGQISDKTEKKISSLFDIKFTEFINDNKLNLKYIPPFDFCPYISFQKQEEKNINNDLTNEYSNDPQGFCGVWGIYYLELRLSNPNLKNYDLIQYAIQTIKESPKSFRRIIRNYSNSILLLRNQFMKKVDKNCKHNCVSNLLNLKVKTFI